MVTGASKGFGFLIAQGLAKEGFKVYGGSRSKPADECAFKFVEMDVTKDDSVKTAVDSIIKTEGKIDVLVNNAGMALPLQSIQNTAIADIQKLFELNYFGLIRVTQAVLPHMLKNNKSGHIINVSSGISTVGMPFYTAYTASKAAVDRTTEGLLGELADTDITVQLLTPGYCPGNQNFGAKFMEKFNDNDEVYKAPIQRYLGKMQQDFGPIAKVEPQEVADMAVKMVKKEKDATAFKCYPGGGLKQAEYQNKNWSNTYQHQADFVLSFTAKKD